MDHNDLKLRSEAVQDILTKPPRRIIRWGSTIIACGLLMLLIGSFFIYYPDVIKADIIITTEKPPTWIIARTSGNLKEIFKKNHEKVYKEDMLAVIDNPSLTSDVLCIKKLCTDFNLNDSIISVNFPIPVNLGNIQVAYSSFLKSLEEYNYYFSIDIYGHKIQSMKDQLTSYKNHQNQINNQIRLSEKNLELSEKEYKREESLYSKGLIDLSTFENSEKQTLSARMSLEELITSITYLNIQITELQSDLKDLELQNIQEYRALKTNLQVAFNELTAHIKEWEQLYLLKSPIDGVLSFNEIWKENQYVRNGDKIFSVVNAGSNKIIGRLQFPLNGSGKVKEGQQINIQVNGYPYLEYGFITANIESISLLPNEDKYTAIINMPQKLVTSYNKELTFKGELYGVAEILTDNRSFGERLLTPFRYISEKYFVKTNAN